MINNPLADTKCIWKKARNNYLKIEAASEVADSSSSATRKSDRYVGVCELPDARCGSAVTYVSCQMHWRTLRQCGDNMDDERLIFAVQRRPALYSKSQHISREHTRRLWIECANELGRDGKFGAKVVASISFLVIQFVISAAASVLL